MATLATCSLARHAAGLQRQSAARPLVAARPAAPRSSFASRLQVTAVAAPDAAPAAPSKAEPSYSGAVETYAVVEIGGHQLIVEEGRWYTVNRLEAEPGSKLAMGRVLALKSGGKFQVGQPYLEGVAVHAEVLEELKGPKVIVYKMKAKKHYRRLNGHRQPLSKILITKIGAAAAAPPPPAAPAPAPVPAPTAPAPAPSAEPLASAAAPGAPAAEGPAAEVQAVGGGPCACTPDGMSGGANTTRAGCGQWDIVSGSNSFTCFVVDPAGCTAANGPPLAPVDAFPGAATRECTQSEAAPTLPTISRLIVSTPQLASFASALRLANLTSIPGEQVSVLAPSNQAFNAAVYSGKDPAWLKKVMLASIIPQRLSLAQMIAAGNLTAADGSSLAVRTQAGGKRASCQTIVGQAGVVLPDITATNGVLHIMDGVLCPAIAPVPALPVLPPAAAAAPVAPSPKAPALAPTLPAAPVPSTAPPGSTSLVAGGEVASQLTGGCACTATGASGGVQTGQRGCARRVDSGFLFPVSLCYVVSPATCVASLQSTRYPGAAWKLC
ncbi:50S ribosomal L21 [Micractinium conductrix]|uniref:50S ribosomal L21 n=1 Tax=Micractinium conductrix TaxID=554055 RepID=A0A2P6VJE7_9CHLO|nr:50S ribosomal L21 [Micractinium conductrix]|eukprot:PSC74226.1 50S ribosomal L21 [Micractinium conductrix]